MAAEKVLVAAARYEVYVRFCRTYGLDPRSQARWVHEQQHLQGVRDRTVWVVAGPGAFPAGFFSYLAALRTMGHLKVRYPEQNPPAGDCRFEYCQAPSGFCENPE